MSPRRSSSGRSTKRRRKSRRSRKTLAGTIGIFVASAGIAAIGVALIVGRPSESTPGPEETVWNGGRVRVEVQNGGGVTGMARAATDRLRPSGFDVVKYGNARGFDPERPSVVIDRVGRLDQARAVANALGIDNVLSEPDPNLYVDVTVLVGREWNPEAPGERRDASSASAWWDPRDWFSH